MEDWRCPHCYEMNNSNPIGEELDKKVFVCKNCGKKMFRKPPPSPEVWGCYMELVQRGLKENLMLD